MNSAVRQQSPRHQVRVRPTLAAEQGPTPAAGQGRSRRFPSWRVILREPFRAETWRRVAYLLLALPVGVLCVPVALVGGPAGKIQLALLRRVLGTGIEGRERSRALGAVHAVVSAPLNLVALVVVLYCWFVVAINLGFPLRVDDPTTSWGGPTMAGAWAVHAVGGGVTFLFLTPWIAKGFGALQVRLAQGFLGRDRSGLRTAAGLAVAVVAVCGLLSVPVIHQMEL
ncbi:hypothetical protein ACH4SP_19875 [Streptomyces sp. NPDC021093]|uniref:hypothetical protein n=1 Tax=Streptomyces sp. NPDC021093 TaxID=3365112 RepID=UPI00378830E8